MQITKEMEAKCAANLQELAAEDADFGKVFDENKIKDFLSQCGETKEQHGKTVLMIKNWREKAMEWFSAPSKEKVPKPTVKVPEPSPKIVPLQPIVDEVASDDTSSDTSSKDIMDFNILDLI